MEPAFARRPGFSRGRGTSPADAAPEGYAAAPAIACRAFFSIWSYFQK
ncbi:MAG: hypothetical protein P9M00_09350 [Candidatus Tritonobacter lacicola]|nr:hypothetical protein [Candidatus Tritonobacter lacicola]